MRPTSHGWRHQEGNGVLGLRQGPSVQQARRPGVLLLIPSKTQVYGEASESTIGAIFYMHALTGILIICVRCVYRNNNIQHSLSASASFEMGTLLAICLFFFFLTLLLGFLINFLDLFSQ